MAKEQIYIDLIPGKLPPTCHASQYDIGRTIRINLTEGGAPYTLDGTETITVEVRKPDGNFVTASCTATLGNTYVDVVTTEQMTACAGMNLCNLKIEKGGSTIGTLNFIMAVEQDPIDGASASESVIENLQAMVNDAIAASPYPAQVTELSNDVLVTTNNFYTKSTYAAEDLTSDGAWIDDAAHIYAVFYSNSAYSHIEIDINPGDKIIISTLNPATIINYYLIQTEAYTSRNRIVYKDVSDGTQIVNVEVNVPYDSNANKLFVNVLTSQGSKFSVLHYKTTEKLRTIVDNADFTKYNKPYIKDGEVCCNKITDSLTAYYAGLDCGYCAKPKKITAKLKFEKKTSTSGVAALILNPNGLIKVSNITKKSLHFVMDNLHYTINLLNNGSDDGPLKSSTFTYPIPLNNKEITVELAMTSDTTMTIDIYYETDSGTPLHVQESATIPSGTLYDYAGRYFTFEHYCNGNIDNVSMPKFTYIKVEGDGFITIEDDFNRENGLLNVTPGGLPYVLITSASTAPELYTQANPYFRSIRAAANCEVVSGGYVQNGHTVLVQARVKATANTYMTLQMPASATDIVIWGYKSDGSALVGRCNSEINFVFPAPETNENYNLLFSYISQD